MPGDQNAVTSLSEPIDRASPGIMPIFENELKMPLD
jgi:hypothetical protein